MFGFRKKKEKTKNPEKTAETVEKSGGLFKKLRNGLSKTGGAVTGGVGTLILGKKKIDDEVLEELETNLLIADVGIEATRHIISELTKRIKRNKLKDVDALMDAMHETMTDILKP